MILHIRGQMANRKSRTGDGQEGLCAAGGTEEGIGDAIVPGNVVYGRFKKE